MNHATPQADSLPSNQPMLTAQSDPVELYQELCSMNVLFEKTLDACVEYRKQLDASQAEAERLKSDKAHLITQCANLLEAANLLESNGITRICKDWGKIPSVEWQRSHKVLLK